MKIDVKFQNRDHTVGIVSAPERNKMKRIPGYFNKELFEDWIKLFNLFGVRDMALYYYEDESMQNSAILLLCPDEEKDTYICVAGKTEQAE